MSCSRGEELPVFPLWMSSALLLNPVVQVSARAIRLGEPWSEDDLTLQGNLEEGAARTDTWTQQSCMVQNPHTQIRSIFYTNTEKEIMQAATAQKPCNKCKTMEAKGLLNKNYKTLMRVKTPKTRKMSHIHELEELTLLKCPHRSKQFTDSMHPHPNTNDILHITSQKTFPNSYASTKGREYPNNPIMKNTRGSTAFDCKIHHRVTANQSCTVLQTGC